MVYAVDGVVLWRSRHGRHGLRGGREPVDVVSQSAFDGVNMADKVEKILSEAEHYFMI
jgi:hypothetical protein